MDDLLNYVADVVKLSPEILWKIITSVLVIIFLWMVRFIILRVVSHRSDDVRLLYSWRKGTTYVTVIIGILILGRFWFTGFQALTTYLGLVSAGIAIALKEPLVNLAGWVFIIWRRPFTVGDRVQIGNYKGDVIDLRIFQFTLMEIGNWVDAEQSTGRVIRIPNGKVFTEMLANYTKGFRYLWNEIPVLITFESDWKKAKKILNRIGYNHAEHLSKSAARKVQEASEQFMIFYTKLTPTVYTSVKDSGVILTIRYLCDPRERRSTEQAIWEDILNEFSECNDIDFAYPTQRFYNNAIEGKVNKNNSRN